MLSGFEVYGELYMVQNSSGPSGWSLPNPPDIYTRGAQRPCEAGYYCRGGVKTSCPPGTFGESVALRSHLCSGMCPAGFYCPAGSVHPRQRPCGGTTVYCPTGSAETICPLGSYCIDGVRRKCPPGRFGDTHG